MLLFENAIIITQQQLCRVAQKWQKYPNCFSHRKSPGRLPAAKAADDLPLGEDGEALVEPEVLKIIIDHQVAGP